MRTARPLDKAPLMEFISRIWGGHDYIPKVWDDWMHEPGAKTFVVEADGRPVGMNRVKFQVDGTAWLEGARIHPEFRGKGLASLLGENSIRVAAKRGVTTMRLVSNVRNGSARRQVARMRFAEIARMSVYNPKRPSRPGSKLAVRIASASDISRILRLAVASEEFRIGGGVFWDGFRAISINEKTVRTLVKERRALVSGDAVAFFKRGAEGDEPFTQIGFACGDYNGVRNLIRHIFRTERGKRVLRYLNAPTGSPLAGFAKRAGLNHWSTFILFQRKTPNG